MNDAGGRHVNIAVHGRRNIYQLGNGTGRIVRREKSQISHQLLLASFAFAENEHVMDHNGGGNEIPDMPSTQLCRMGCGFYGCQGFDGMCSKCHKDHVKRRQQNQSPTPLATHLGDLAAAAAAPSEYSSASVVDANVSVEKKKAVLAAAAAAVANAEAATSSPCPAPVDRTTTPSVETASPTVPSSLIDKEKSDSAEATVSGWFYLRSDILGVNGDLPADKDKKSKKNRCHTCKKKVGLTGFECRCGGLYCGLHRYSDKHDCTFDYKELGQRQIRKANPVVVGLKIQKI
ncbi:hypothetical protein CAPTEDRAFT_171714 [Capitella teleta]|uniref:AN1-type domain-containing protein n=1 Tax=Capitella teleta TaxID=283909 RepID=R7US86_CAPTE|nr:hypothetical protein CAPTEDRAFT_171714 [Capitella teleta]|eukprot:ELU09379.1 hypothetical protein CAPTEDRAFT_171714 [Capitella teleta]